MFKYIAILLLALLAFVAAQPIDLRTNETVAYVWLESGEVALDDSDWVHISTNLDTFVNGVVLISLPDVGGDTHDQGLATAARIKNVVNYGRVSFDVKLFQPNDTYCTDFTATFMTQKALVSWMVVEEGAYNLTGHIFLAGFGEVTRNSVSLDANNHPYDTNWTNSYIRIDYPTGCLNNVDGECRFPDELENLDAIGSVATIQSFNYPKYMLLRQSTTPKLGFIRVVLTPHDSDIIANYNLTKGETVGYFNFEFGLSISCIEKMTFETRNFTGITSFKFQYEFYFNYSKPPAVFGLINTQRSITDSTALRVFDRTNEETYIITQEDTCEDPETEHTTPEFASILVVGELEHGDVICGSENTPSDPYCADLMLYDVFGDGWGNDTFLEITFSDGLKVMHQLDCKWDFIHICSVDGGFNFTVKTVANPLMYSWEVYWILKYYNDTRYGTIGTWFTTWLDDIVQEHQPLNYDKYPLNSTECDQCKHPKPPAGPKGPGAGHGKGPGPKGPGADDGPKGPGADDGPKGPGVDDQVDDDLGRRLHGSDDISNKTSDDASAPVAKPKPSGPPKPVEFPFTLFDIDNEGGDGWFYEWVRDDGNGLGYAYHFGFAIPNAWLYPRYYITNDERTEIIEDGTMCLVGPKEICVATLPPHGDFVFRVGGLGDDDDSFVDTRDWDLDQDGDDTWDFCGVHGGRVGDEVIFQMRHGKCHAVQVISFVDYCNGVYTLAALEGSLQFTGVGSTSLSEFDSKAIEEQLKAALNAVDVILTSWTLSDDKNLIVNFKASAYTEESGFEGFSAVGVDNFVTKVTETLNTLVSGGLFLGQVFSSLSTLQSDSSDVLYTATAVTLLKLELTSVSYVSAQGESSQSNSQFEIDTVHSVQVNDGFSMSAGVVAIAMVAVGGVVAIVAGFKLSSKAEHVLLAQESEHVAMSEVTSVPKKSLFVQEQGSIGVYKSRERL